MSEKIMILNALLDKYERSEFFKTGASPTRKIMLRFYDGSGKSDFPYYNIEESTLRKSVNQAVLELSGKEIISCSWMDKNHIVASVWLNISNMRLAYQMAKRQPKNDIIEDVCVQLDATMDRVRSPWAQGFLNDVHGAVSQKRSLTSQLPADKAERDLLFKAIVAIDGLDGAECMKRVFSMKTFGNSKTFEKFVEKRLLRILKKYSDNDDDVTDEDLLKQAGIVQYPEQFEFCGDVSIEFDTGVADFSPLAGGSTIFSSDLLRGKIKIGESVNTINTIENKANYIDYVSAKHKDELVIYHGGQFSPRKKLFFSAVATAAPKNCKWYHWSDIDYGGFLMLLRLRRDILPIIMPHRMNRAELEKYSDFTQEIKPTYAEKLKSLKAHPELFDCDMCIEYMVSNMLKLEQEALLLY